MSWRLEVYGHVDHKDPEKAHAVEKQILHAAHEFAAALNKIEHHGYHPHLLTEHEGESS